VRLHGGIEKLGDVVHLSSPVRTVTQREDHVSWTPKGDARYGLLASFAFSRVALNLDSLDDDERRKAILDALVQRFGPRAASPADFVTTSWWNEPWTRGCSMAHFPCGVLTRYGYVLRQPFGRVHFAGTETSTISHGAVDGAVRSGERVANEIIEGI